MSRSIKKDYPRKNDSRHFDWSCKNGGSCEYCRSNRLFFDSKARTRANIGEQTQDLEFPEMEEFDECFDSL